MPSFFSPRSRAGTASRRPILRGSSAVHLSVSALSQERTKRNLAQLAYPQRGLQHVLKAEAFEPDATDRSPRDFFEAVRHHRARPCITRSCASRSAISARTQRAQVACSAAVAQS